MDGRSIVGRHRERALLREILDGKSNPRIVSISGVAGIGKSNLVDAFLDGCRDRNAPAIPFRLREWLDDPSYAALTPVVSMLEALLPRDEAAGENGLTWGQTSKMVRRYRHVHDRIVSKFRGDEPKVSALLRVGLAAVRAGGTLTPQVGPLVSLVSDDLIAAVTDVISRGTKEADRLLIEHPAEHMAESVVRDLRWTCRHSRAPCVVVALDDYQLAPPELDRWLRRLAGGDYGKLDRRLVFLVSGRVPLGSDWIVHRSAEGPGEILHIPLGPLSAHDVAEFLRPRLKVWRLEEEAARGARYLDDCGRIPLLLRLLAHDPRKLVADLRNGLHRSHSHRFEWGLALEEFIERFLDDGRLDASDRSAIVALSIPRVLNDETVRLTLDTAGIPRKDAYREWLTRADFVDPAAPPYTLHEPVRKVFLDSLAQRNPDQLRSVHLCLASYYRDRVRDAPVDRWWHLSQIEATYHQLSGTGVHEPSAILQRLLEGLPETYGLLPNWSLMLDQVLHEQTHVGDRAKDALQRLVSLSRRTWDLANLTSPEIVGGGSVDPAVDVFGADLLAGEALHVSEASYEHWLRCFEIRLEMIRGDRPLEEIRDALGGLYLECERQSSAPDAVLLTSVATDLAEALTRMGKIPDALRWSRKALDLVSAGSSDFRGAVALINLGSNLKRADDFSGALDQFSLASELLVGWRPLPRYRLGLLMLDRANCCSYLGDTGEAASALAAARQYLDGVSPQALAEASHRLGWKRRLEGDLEGSLEDHLTAIRQFDEVEARARHDRFVPSAVLRILRAKAQHSMANTLTEMHRAQDALQLYRQARAVFLDLGQHRHAAIVQKDMAMAQSVVEGTDDAIATLESLLDGFRHRSDHYLGGTHALEGVLSLARICLLSGRLDKAREAIAEAERLRGSLADANPQLDVRIRLEGCLATVLEGGAVDGAELAEIERQIAGWPAPRTDLHAYAELVGAVVQANAGSRDRSRQHFQRAREQAGRWNRFLPHDLDLIWAARRNADAPRREVELFDTYDEHGHFLEAISSEIVHREGRWHRSFHCWITGQDQAGRKTVLFQRRGAFSRDFPNLLDISSAGHYRAGEGVDGGLRELREELNLEIRPEALQLLATRRISETLYNGRRNNEVQDVYLLARPTHALVDYRPAYPEVAAVVQCRLDLVLDLLAGAVHVLEASSHEYDPASGSFVLRRTSISRGDFIPEALDYLMAVLSLIDRGPGMGDRRDNGLDPVTLKDGSDWRLAAP